MEITTDQVIADATSGAVTVLDSATLILDGRHDGSIEVMGGGNLVVRGELRGPLTVNSLAHVNIHGDVVGPVDVLVAATVVIEKEGRLSGPITNYGSITNFGLRAGHVEGREPDDKDGSVNADAGRGGSTTPYHLPPR